MKSTRQALQFFIYLQCLDVITTLVFLHSGVAEGNPLMRLAFAGSLKPAAALLLAKSLGIGLAGYAWISGRSGLLRKMNIVFTVCVVWNVVAIFASPVASRAAEAPKSVAAAMAQ